MSIITDKNGKTSSKRIAGFILLGLGALIKVAVSVFSFLYKLPDPSTILTASDTLLYVGGSLLGIGVLENIGSKKE